MVHCENDARLGIAKHQNEHQGRLYTTPTKMGDYLQGCKILTPFGVRVGLMKELDDGFIAKKSRKKENKKEETEDVHAVRENNMGDWRLQEKVGTKEK